MEREDDPTLDTAMRLVARYGIRRVTMTDLAQEAGVSRQTLYDRFGDKDGIMAAVVRRIAHQIRVECGKAFAAAPGLSEKIDAYIRIGIIPIHEMLASMPDAADLQHGQGPASVAASREAEAAKAEMLTAMLRPHLPPDGPAAEDVADFIEQASGSAKMSGMARKDLDRFLAVLKSAVLALAAAR